QNLAKLLQFFTLFQDRVDMADLAGVLQIEAAGLAGALKVEAGDDGPDTLTVRDLARVATPKNKPLRELNLAPERVLNAARALAEANRQSFCTVHPSYTTMVRTGRTSCSKPNVQQVPKDSAFRQAFVASPDHFLLAVDYSFIELRTFAATALQRY